MTAKSLMFSARVPAALVERIDYVARNADGGSVKNRSDAIREALEAWLPGQEERLQQLGVMPRRGR